MYRTHADKTGSVWVLQLPVQPAVQYLQYIDKNFKQCLIAYLPRARYVSELSAFPTRITKYAIYCIILYYIIFIHSVFCLTTGPKLSPKRCLHIVRSRASSLKWDYPLLSLRSFSSFLRLLPRLLATSISPFIFSSITCFRRQFLRKMWPIQLAFRFIR